MPTSRARSPDRPHRTWAQRALITVNAFAVLAAVVTAMSLGYSNDRVADLTRTIIPSGVLRDDAARLTEARNFLIVGVDDPSRLAEGDAVKVRDPQGKLTDTIMVLRLDPEAETADLLSFPRDLYVPLAASGSSGRINAAFNAGGATRLIQTIAEDFGIPIDHYVEIDFAGFRELVDAVDGVPLQFPHPVRSVETTELDVPAAGCWVLGPRQALAFARTRKDYQVQDADGDWHTDPGGDYARVRRQQLFVQLAVRQAITKGARNPNTLRRLVELGASNVTVDADLTADLAVELGRVYREFDPADLAIHTLPVDESPQGGPAYLYLREDEAEATLDVFRDDDQAGGSASIGDVVVRVQNGTGTPGQAGQVTQELADAGFETLVPDVDVPVGFPTLVVYGEGDAAAAFALARSMAGPITYQSDPSAEEGVVVLVTGTDWLGVSTAPRPAEEVASPPSPAGAPADPVDPVDAAAAAPGGTEDPGELGDSDDPDDPAFYRAGEPVPGADCQRTP